MRYILTINSGSSSLKFSVYNMGRSEELLLSGEFDRMGLPHGIFRAQGEKQDVDLPDHHAALRTLFEWLRSHGAHVELDAVGHRLVSGGRDYDKPQLITPKLIETLEKLVSFAPEHLPHELKAVQAAGQTYPGLPQVACFDTAFHWQSPKIAKLYPLPRRNILLIAPGFTVKNRLHVLVPGTPGNYYTESSIIPPDLEDKLRRGQTCRVVIHNWHKLDWESEQQIAKKRSADKRGAKSDEAYVRDVLQEMESAQNLVVINDEAHHAWRVPGTKQQWPRRP